MRTIETPEKYLSNVDSKSDMRKVRTSPMNLSAIVFLFNKCNVSPYAVARVATIVAMKISKIMDHTKIFDAVTDGDKKLIPTFYCHYWLCNYHIGGSTYVDCSKILKRFF